MRSSKLFSLTLCSALTLLGGMTAFADDTEVFFNISSSTSTSSSNPNILLILDTSSSMNASIAGTYVASTTYSATTDMTGYATCNNSAYDNYVWYVTSGKPTCNGPKIPKSQLYCSPATNTASAATEPLDTGGAGFYAGKAARWKFASSKYSWTKTFGDTGALDYITCKNHVPSSGYARLTAAASNNMWDGTSGSNFWTSSSAGTSYTFYSANYVRFVNNTASGGSQTRESVMKAAVTDLIGALEDVNIGLMQYDSATSTDSGGYNAKGGMILQEMKPVSDVKTTLPTTVNALKMGRNTPLSETLYEAYLYYAGKQVYFGDTSGVCSVDVVGEGGSCPGPQVDTPSVKESRVGGVIHNASTGGVNGTDYYDSPADNTCQKNFVVFLTDGEATHDTDASSLINGLTTSDTTCSNTSDGACLGNLTQYMYKTDLRTDVGTSTDSVIQNVSTSFIALGDDVDATYLNDAATKGGGKAYDADSYTDLITVFTNIFNSIADTEATFTSPSVAVNAFNKTQVLEDMYVAMFKPDTKTHWDGNLKKFKLRDSKIVGRGSTMTSVDTVSAVGSNGFFTDATKDFWHQLSDTTNTDLTTKGGAANRLPSPASRDVYTYISADNAPSSPVALSGHLFKTTNTILTDNLVGTGPSTTTCGTACTKLINWTRGDADGDSATTTDPRNRMGDPIHSQPAVVIYGQDDTTLTTQLNDAVVYVATNDGLLQAIDVSSGIELWSYIPQELIKDGTTHDLLNVYTNADVTPKHYSLDGDIRVLKYDQNGNGIVENNITVDGVLQNDRVFLYFSQGRGGDNYYALEVTEKDNPKFLWSLGSSDLSKVNKSWSTPSLGRVNVSGASPAQNGQKLVLIFGGGYSDEEDNQSYQASDTYGNAIYMVDAVKGTVLWEQTYSSDTSSAFNKMTHAIPSSVTVLDTNADGYSDRMYVGDMAGQVWRFDIFNGKSATSTTDPLVTGGVIASLGHQSGDTGDATNRSFYNAPDVAKFIVQGAANYYNIAIGSGDRALPKSNVTTQDFFYSIRDYRLQPISQTTYDGLTSIKHDDLTTVTGLSATTIGSNGWKLALTSAEKVLAQSATVNGVVMFTTFIPGGSSSGCSVTTGSGRAYTVKIADGMKYFTDPDTSVTTDGNGLYETFQTTGLPSQVSIVNEGNIIRTDGTTDTATPTKSGTCLSGVTILGNCVDYGSRIKTFWQESGAN